jgi:hypothetical protein
VNVALSGLHESWEPFVQGICAREQLPRFDRLWTDCTEEEAQLESRNDKHKGNSDENQALVAHTRKGRRGGSPEPRRKKDLSMVKCFACHEYGHYASQFPQRRRGGRKHQASIAKLDEVANRLQRDNSDENRALVSHTRKGIRGGSPEPRRKKDLSKVKCFACHEYGHYASQCPQRRRGGKKQQASATEVDEVADRLQREFLLVSTLSCTVSGDGTWLVDNGASCHMTGA